jgi:riboflavin synthase
MFTGLIQTQGTVHASEEGQGGKTLWLKESLLGPKLVLGESVAVNGACLTVTQCEGEHFSFQVGPETLAKTNLGLLKPGATVNLERSLCIGDSLGGHFVTGHVDCLGTVADKTQEGDWLMMGFDYAPEFGELMVDKGSIAVDGVSLTLVEVRPERFLVMLIPHTRDNTTLGQKGVGDKVNLEFDILAKHVQKLVKNINRSKDSG